MLLFRANWTLLRPASMLPVRALRPAPMSLGRLWVRRPVASVFSTSSLRADYSDVANPPQEPQTSTYERKRLRHMEFRKSLEGTEDNPSSWLNVIPDPTRIGEEHATADKWIRGTKYRRNAIHVYVDYMNCYRIKQLHLRDACQCPKCVDPSTKQRKFKFTDIPFDIQIDKVANVGGKIQVKWFRDMPGYGETHVSAFSKQDLERLLPLTRGNRTAGVQLLWNRDYMKKIKPTISFDDYMRDGEAFITFLRDLRRYGLAFISGVPEATDMVEKLATRIGPLRNSFYGSTWDVRSVPDAKNVAYTNQFLDFHMDLLYMKEPPGLQLLHCMENSLSGGESLFSDAISAAENLRRLQPHLFRLLCEFPIKFGYSNAGQEYSEVRPTIELRKGLDGHEINNEAGPVSHVNYSPPFQHPFRRTKSKDWDRHLKNFSLGMQHFTRLLSSPSSVFETKLNPGECVIFENRRVVHARKGFDMPAGTEQNAERWLRGAYVDMDSALSKYKVLKAENRELWDAMHLHPRPRIHGVDRRSYTPKVLSRPAALDSDVEA